MEQLTEHFRLVEFLRTNHSTMEKQREELTPEIEDNLFRLATELEKVRKLFGDRRVKITSGFRPEDVNRAVGGVPNSLHKVGCAGDIVIPDFSPVEVAVKIRNSSLRSLFEEIIPYSAKKFTHLAVPR